MKSRDKAKLRKKIAADFAPDGPVGQIFAIHYDADTAFLVFGFNRGDAAISRAKVIPDDKRPGMSQYIFDRSATPEECAWVRAQGPPPQGEN